MPTLDVRLIRQIEDYYCGAAVAAMMLDFRQLKPVGVSDADWQDDIWNRIVAATTGPPRPAAADGAESALPDFAGQQCVFCANAWSCWATTPQALEAVLNSRFAADQQSSILRVQFLPDLAVAAIINAIDAGGPAAALIDDGNHWVVVRGYKADKSTPPPISIAGRNLNGVYIRDPFPGTPSRGLMAAEEFLNQRFFPIDCGVAADDDRYVVIVPNTALRQERRMDQRRSEDEEPGQPMLTPEAALTLAAVQAKKLLEEDEEPALDPLLNARPGQPVLVQRIDRRDSFFYIVPFEDQGHIVSRMAIDARTGTVKEVQWIEDASASLPRWRSAQDILAGQKGPLFPPRDSGATPAGSPPAPDTPRVHPVLVWRPCRESRSMFTPFHLVTGGDQQRYLRVDDGKVFERLTSGGKGW